VTAATKKGTVTMEIRAVTEKPTFNIEAAVASLGPDVRRLAACAEIPVGRISVADIDAKLSASRFSTIEKLQLKIGLNRAGLLTD
jgi:hypothetical protein